MLYFLNEQFCHIGQMCFQNGAFEIQLSQKRKKKRRPSECWNILLEADSVVTRGDRFVWSLEAVGWEKRPKKTKESDCWMNKAVV